jgi:flagellar motor protein MotB
LLSTRIDFAENWKTIMTTWKPILLLLLTTTSSAVADTLGETFFDFDSAELRPDADVKLAEVSEMAAEVPDARLVLSGHADERGGEAYNVGLSTRRAEAVRDALVARGIGADRMVLAVYGEDGPSRGSYAQDRRVTILLTSDPLHEIIDTRLGPATALVWSKPATVAEIEGPTRDQTARR